MPIHIKVTKQLRRDMHLRKLDYGKISLTDYILRLVLQDLKYSGEAIDQITKEIKRLDKK